jgi:hypothetical protein
LSHNFWPSGIAALSLTRRLWAIARPLPAVQRAVGGDH